MPDPHHIDHLHEARRMDEIVLANRLKVGDTVKLGPYDYGTVVDVDRTELGILRDHVAELLAQNMQLRTELADANNRLMRFRNGGRA